jgi:ribosome recycling factor
MFDTKPYEEKMNQAFAHFEESLKKVRTGRAHPGMLDGVVVEAYGAKMPLNQVANVLAPEAQLLQVTPFDPTNLAAIASAIRDDQSLGFNPSDDGRIIRVPVPPLTTERRAQIAKQLGEKVEECRIALRGIRHDALKAAKKAKDDKDIPENEAQRAERTIDQRMSDMQGKLEAAAKAKETEIMTI